MGGIGKNPHRPEGKVDTDAQHAQASYQSDDPPHHASRFGRNEKAVAQQNRENQIRMQGGPAENFHEQDQVGGSRPGVPSRVKDAIERVQEREAEDENA